MGLKRQRHKTQHARPNPFQKDPCGVEASVTVALVVVSMSVSEGPLWG